jgi:hypothetical protein
MGSIQITVAIGTAEMVVEKKAFDDPAFVAKPKDQIGESIPGGSFAIQRWLGKTIMADRHTDLRQQVTVSDVILPWKKLTSAKCERGIGPRSRYLRIFRDRGYEAQQWQRLAVFHRERPARHKRDLQCLP